ncbi:hypothetical protein BCR35DRAFT_349332 [Leucosporidium creatinivorum]|uniref:Uncharacterized protein n=1 Tax=Leucosporidium creatinivorum TaxID=106004 RepID=A0A1Y2G2A6_9BASI|nr:hypothetical protein BCR35DRAFT_349332 [Leucosporidium creatinivorum]
MDGHPELDRCSREQLIEMVARHKEELAEVQEKNEELEQTRSSLVNESSMLTRDLESAKGRIDELMAEEGRMEEELAGRIEVLEKLRASVRELEREKRDATKRYREQADSFDSERQSWYDQEQHYKLRISNLTSNNRKTTRGSLANDLPKPKPTTAESDLSEAENDDEPRLARSTSPATPSLRSSTASPTPSASVGPTPAELALQDQLASLTTAHDSLSSTLRTLQTEMSDLKRVYQDLQEENESYEILLGEKTLNGEVRGSELFRQSFHWGESGEDGPSQGLGFLGGLEAVGEGDEEDFSDLEGEDDYDSDEEDDVDRILLESRGVGSSNSGAVAAGTSSRRNSRQTKKKRPSGGLDLAAELEAAQMEDSEAEEIERKKQAKLERRRASQARRQSAAQGMGERRGSIMPGSVEGLRDEVKQLREANKALTLYVSKIVDRVCSQEGFEKVLAVDYRTGTPKSAGIPSPNPPQQDDPPAESIKFRPGSLFRSSSISTPAAKELGPKDKEPATPTSATSGAASTPTSSGHRKGGLGWDSFSSVFSSALSRTSASPSPSPSGNNPLPPTPGSGLKPLTLPAEVSARKLEVEEDEDDIRERERLRATMAQHGLEPASAGNQWGAHVPSGAPDSPSPPPPPKDVEAEAAAVIISTKQREEDAKAELNQGRASGFTDAPKKRRPGSMRSSSRSSSISMNGLGIGIDGRVTPEGSPALGESVTGSPRPMPSPKAGEAETGEEQPIWGKAMRRLSRGWASPPLS